MAAAAADAAAIGSVLSVVNATAAPPTTAVALPGADEVSAAVATLFSKYGKAFQALSAQAARLHQQFVQALSAAAGAYTGAEAANANTLRAVGQDLLGAVNATSQTLLGRPLIGNASIGVSGQSGVAQTTAVPLTNVQGQSSALGGGIALVMGGTGLPTPYPRYADTPPCFTFNRTASPAPRRF